MANNKVKFNLWNVYYAPLLRSLLKGQMTTMNTVISLISRRWTIFRLFIDLLV